MLVIFGDAVRAGFEHITAFHRIVRPVALGNAAQ
jgi:hypothetical protein